jgi:membrane-bound lytic murein transglycosylase A
MNSCDARIATRNGFNRNPGDTLSIARHTAPALVLLIASLAMVAASAAQSSDAPPLPTGATAEQLSFASIAGFEADDHAAAFQTFLVSCRARRDATTPLRAGLPTAPGLAEICEAALKAGDLDGPAARRFFEQSFVPWRIAGESGRAFYTGYFEPEVEGSFTRGGRYQTPVLDRPPDLVTLPQGEVPEGFEGYAAARQSPDGVLSIYPNRTEIEEGALDGLGLEHLYLADPVDLFFVQVQGSGRVRLPDGSVVRLAYAGRNGHPYTAIGRVVADRYEIPRAEMTMQRLRAFLAEDDERARSIMRENRSYVFFRLARELDPSLGPIGGQGVPLTPWRSIAIDRSLWSYGLPVFVNADLPTGPDGALEPFRHLMIAQDTGSAILGPARADIFFGPGAVAGAIAGAVRHPGEFIVLWPRATQ